MGKHATIKQIEHKIRSSLIYHAWQSQNLASACLSCDSTENLQVHHVVEMYHIVLGLWKLYGDEMPVISHALSMHEDNRCENVTLCADCHAKIHPARTFARSDDVRVEQWTVIPRKFPAPFLHNSRGSEPGLSLLSSQLLAGFGWYILGGNMDSGMLEFKRISMGNLIGKVKGSSLNNSIERSLRSLQELDVIIGWNITGPNVEVHLSPTYIDSLKAMPWFMSIDDIKTGKMSVFSLRWFLGLQSGRKNYRIGRKKLAGHLGLQTSTPQFMGEFLDRAMQDIPWATHSLNGNVYTFTIRRRGSTPIWTLRSLVMDAIEQGL